MIAASNITSFFFIFLLSIALNDKNTVNSSLMSPTEIENLQNEIDSNSQQDSSDTFNSEYEKVLENKFKSDLHPKYQDFFPYFNVNNEYKRNIGVKRPFNPQTS